MEGWIKLHRKSLESIVFQNPNLWQVWCYCLMRANHQETKKLWNQKEEVLKEGSFITGRLEGGKDCNMNPNTFYKQLKTLERINCIQIEARNKFSIVSVINWQKYQFRNNKNTDSDTINKGRNEGDPKNRNNRVTTKEQQNNTDKNNKNEKNKKERASLFAEKVFNNNGYDKETLSEFIDYWTESGDNDKKLRFEKEKVFDINRRIKTWMRNQEKWNVNKYKAEDNNIPESQKYL